MMKINGKKMCSNAYFGGFTGGGHFWRVTQMTKRLGIANYICHNMGIKCAGDPFNMGIFFT